MHTSKLKRKLDNMGVDFQSSSPRMTENFCLIGTPLPPLEKSKDTGEFVPLWKQEVRDEKGRRRLHGAFTGGFSAGYFNTVGSKEGWTPSTFISSRTDRAKTKQVRPEDFMDEEDLAEIRESKKLIDTAEEADILGGTQAGINRRGSELENDPIATALQDLLPPAKDSVGARILKKMGWRLGQGIGPRITYKQLRGQESHPISLDQVVDEEATKHLYAPRDTKLILYIKKDNASGLGYVPEQDMREIFNRQGDTTDLKPRISAGFGLGALNDTEDDDVDIYDAGGSRERRLMAFDVNEVENEAQTLLGSKPNYAKELSSETMSMFSTFRDGHIIVPGFLLNEKPLIEDRWFPLPDVPKGWSPDPRRVWVTDAQTKEAQPVAPQDHLAWRNGKTADERGSMLGETSLPDAPRSVFDYLSQKDRDRLNDLSASLIAGGPPLKPSISDSSIDTPQIGPQTAQAALKGFQPFTNDPEKQSRYTAFLNSQVSVDVPVITPSQGQTNEQFNKELADFAKAAQIFKPVSGAMAGRFASASTVEVVGNQHHGLHRPTKDDYAKLDKEKGTEGKKLEESPTAHAAKMNMFGPLTRQIKVWQPARLLCKRFGVKDPHPDGVVTDSVETISLIKGDNWQKEIIPNLSGTSMPSTYNSGDTETPHSEKPRGRRDLSNTGLGEDEEQGKETLTYERPSKDIFKAIFASDEEESDDEDLEDTRIEEIKKLRVDAVLNLQADTIPKPYDPFPVEDKVDLSTFKPTFRPKAEREERKKGKGKDKKDKKKNKPIVSFDVEDGEKVIRREGKEGKEGQRKRHRGKGLEKDEEDECMWVEKPAPEVVKDLVIPVTIEPAGEIGLRGRKRAVDFL